MKLLNIQQQLMNAQAMCEIVYKDKMYEKERQLGYTINAVGKYSVVLASDFPDKDAAMIVLLHELGHVELKHCDINLAKEHVFVRNLFKLLNVNYSKIQQYGGPMGFLNYAMDLQINTTYLTPANLAYMKSVGFELLDLQNTEVEEYSEGFRSFYIPLIEILNEKGTGSGKGESAVPNSFLNGDLSNTQVDENSIHNYDETNLTEDELQEIKDNLAKEGYIDNNLKPITFQQNSKTVEQFSEKYNSSNSNNKDVNVGISDSSKAEQIKITSTSKRIANFLKEIVGSGLSYQRDNLKIYNRNSRNSQKTGLLYSSIRRKCQVQNKKLAIIIDISASMNIESVLTAVNTLKNNIGMLHSQCTLFFTNSKVQSVIPITELNKIVEIRYGGGTNMHAGINEAIKRGFNNIVVYSDFDTNNFTSKTYFSNNITYYGISTKGLYHNWGKVYLTDVCKKFIFA